MSYEHSRPRRAGITPPSPPSPRFAGEAGLTLRGENEIYPQVARNPCYFWYFCLKSPIKARDLTGLNSGKICAII